MKYLLAIFTVIVSFMHISAQDIPVLDKYVWKNRVLLLFIESKELPAYQQQLEEFSKHQPGIQDRDLVIFKIISQKVVTPDQKALYGETATELRNNYQVQDAGYTIVLIGKDGGQKLRQNSFLSTDKLFSTIDQMPMRRREMREKSD